MPDAAPVVHAELQGVTWNGSSWVPDGESAFEVPFNPQSLKVTYSNQQQQAPTGGDSQSTQYLGNGTATLALDLLFDATVPPASGPPVSDVRELTAKVRRFVQPKEAEDGDTPPSVPAAQFLWGSFLFTGVVDQIDETLTFFSAEGKPLRATVAFALSSAEIDLESERNPAASGAGTTPQTPAPSGAPLQQLTAGAGVSADWKAVAAANDIENPRLIEAGTLLDLNVSASASVSASLGF